MIARHENGQFVPEVLAISQSADPVWPQIHSRGTRVWVDWEEAPGQMFWVRRDAATGNWDSPQVEPYETQVQRDFFIRGKIQSLAIE